MGMPAMDTRTIINLTQWERQGFMNISQLDNILLFSTRVMELRNKTVTSLTRDWRTRHEVHELYKTAREISTQLIGVDARKDPLLHQWSIDAKYVTDIWRKVAKVP